MECWRLRSRQYYILPGPSTLNCVGSGPCARKSEHKFRRLSHVVSRRHGASRIGSDPRSAPTNESLFRAWRGVSGYLVHGHERADSGCPCCYPSHRLRYHVSRSAHPGFPAELSGYALLEFEEIFELRHLDDKLPLVPGAALEGDAVVHRAVVRAPRYDDVHGCGVG